MTDRMPGPGWRAAVFALLLVPAAHPLLIPLVGVPSHLLWWVHVLPVALLTFRCGRRYALGSLAASAAMVAVGEAAFGAGYGVAADTQTVVALTVALTATNVLVAAFAWYAREVSARYRLLFDRVRMGVVQVATDERITGVNPMARDILKLGDEHPVLGRPVHEVLRPRGVASVRALQARGTWTGQIDLHTPNGRRTIYGLIAAAGHPESGGYQVLLADRSLEVLREQEMERQVKLASLGEALAGVAHELNNPLAGILAHAELGLLEAPRGSAERASFEDIFAGATRMRGLLRELLGFSRTSAESSCARLEDVVARIVRVQTIAVGRGIRIETDLSWGGVVRASGIKIEQILLNLISNAAYAVRRGGGTEIRVATRRRGGWAEVEVSDDGPGIAPEILERVFEPFATTKPEGEGTGLGLAISRRLARTWGGDLHARNSTGGGAVFTLLLPVPDDDTVDCEEAGGAAPRLIA